MAGKGGLKGHKLLGAGHCNTAQGTHVIAGAAKHIKGVRYIAGGGATPYMVVWQGLQYAFANASTALKFYNLLQAAYRLQLMAGAVNVNGGGNK